QSIFEDMYWAGGTGTDSANVNLDAVTLAPFIPSDLVGHVTVTRTQAGCDGSPACGGAMQNEKQQLALSAVTGGTFELFLGSAANHTKPIAWDAPASGECNHLAIGIDYCSVQAALEELTGVGTKNVGVTRDPSTGVYTIEFVGALANKAVAPLTT